MLRRRRQSSIASTTSRPSRRRGLFGGNSNWRGPIWFPVNYLLIEALQKFHHYYGDEFKVECPTGSGTMMTLWEVAAELSRRLTRLFLRDERRPAAGASATSELFQTDPHWRDSCCSTSTSTATTARGVGASHQTGWTALVAKLMQQLAMHPSRHASKEQPAGATAVTVPSGG